jgi:hypothetical protein
MRIVAAVVVVFTTRLTDAGITLHIPANIPAPLPVAILLARPIFRVLRDVRLTMDHSLDDGVTHALESCELSAFRDGLPLLDQADDLARDGGPFIAKPFELT